MNHSVSSLFGAPIPESKILAALQKKPDVLEQFRQFSEEDRSRILAFLAGERSLQILSDRFFKQILNPESTPERLESLLSAVFGQKVTIAGIISREGMQITETGSQVIMDIVVRLQDGALVNVEMQRVGYLFPGQRTSCYLSDLIMKQYDVVRSEKKDRFSYKDLCPVTILVIMDRSSEEFRDVRPEYIHRQQVSYTSGARVETLENVIYISLDTFQEMAENEIGNDLDAWLTFFCYDDSEHVLRLVSAHPEFIPMYQDIANFRKTPEEVIGMFSEALRIMDRNTTKYMFEQLQERVTEQAEQIAEQAEQMAEQEKKHQQEIAAAQEEIRLLREQLAARKKMDIE